MNATIAPSPDVMALDGIKVLDLGHQIAGPYCARLLADQGADVIKVERPGLGDTARNMGPFVGDDPHPEKSLTFLYLNTNKRSITLDLKSEQGRNILLDLVREADVVVENFEPRVLPSLGLDYATLAEINPRIILTSISNFGQKGPRAGWRGNDLINYALSGVMSISGTADKPPLKHGAFQSGFVGGLAGVIPTIAALMMRDITGRGQHIDVSIAEALASTLVLTVPYYAYMGETQTRRESIGDTFSNCAPARDGWVIAHTPRGEWSDFVTLMDTPALADPKFSNVNGRVANAEELDRVLGAALKGRDRFDLFHAANKAKVLFGVVQTPKDLADCEQLASRGFFHEVDHPVAGKLRYPGQTFELRDGDYTIRRRSPLLGEHTTEVLTSRLGYDRDHLRTLDEAGAI